jgi:hypothetical protein
MAFRGGEWYESRESYEKAVILQKDRLKYVDEDDVFPWIYIHLRK